MLDRLFFVFSLFRFVIFSSAVFFFAPHDDDDVPLLWRRLDCARVQMTEPISLPLYFRVDVAACGIDKTKDDLADKRSFFLFSIATYYRVVCDGSRCRSLRVFMKMTVCVYVSRCRVQSVIPQTLQEEKLSSPKLADDVLRKVAAENLPFRVLRALSPKTLAISPLSRHPIQKNKPLARNPEIPCLLFLLKT